MRLRWEAAALSKEQKITKMTCCLLRMVLKTLRRATENISFCFVAGYLQQKYTRRFRGLSTYLLSRIPA